MATPQDPWGAHFLLATPLAWRSWFLALPTSLRFELVLSVVRSQAAMGSANDEYEMTDAAASSLALGMRPRQRPSVGASPQLLHLVQLGCAVFSDSQRPTSSSVLQLPQLPQLTDPGTRYVLPDTDSSSSQRCGERGSVDVASLRTYSAEPFVPEEGAAEDMDVMGAVQDANMPSTPTSADGATPEAAPQLWRDFYNNVMVSTCSSMAAL